MEKRHIKIDAFDTLFFRNGKPFSMGEETWADGYAVPSPSVLYGALRTAISVQNNISFELVKTKLTEEEVKVTCISYLISDKKMFPLPFDMAEYDKTQIQQEREREIKEYIVHELKVIPNTVITSSSKENLDYLLVAHDYESQKVEGITDGVIEISVLQKYLKGILPSSKLPLASAKKEPRLYHSCTAYKLGDYIINEPKVGIGRDDLTHASEKSKLYRVDMKRSTISILLDFQMKSSLSLDTTIIRLGGEMKAVKFDKEEYSDELSLDSLTFPKGLFKLYFATPAVLTSGFPDLSALGITAKPVAACIGKPDYIGGFDMVTRRAKPMYRVVPAGSVFYYEVAGDLSKIKEYQGTSFSDEMKEQGFGVAYFGIWKK